MQQRLASDLQLLEDNFQELRDAIDNYQTELTAAITEHYDQLMDSLRTLTDLQLDGFQADLRAAKDANDLRQVFSLTESMRESVESLRLDSKLVSVDELTLKEDLAPFPDVNKAVRDLKNCTECLLITEVAQVRCAKVSRCLLKLPNSATTVKLNVNGEAQCMALCSNTRGFSIDSSGIIVRTEEGGGSCLLPHSMVVVAFKRRVRSQTGRSVSVIVQIQGTIGLFSVDTNQKGYVNFSWDLDQPIRDLHCDNDRQLLYIAQHDSVSITDLSGDLKSRVQLQHLHSTPAKLVSSVRCIGGDADKLFVLAEMREGRPAIFGLSKDSHEVQLRLTLPQECDLAVYASTRIAACDRMLLVSDDTKIFTICSITGQLVDEESINKMNEHVHKTKIDLDGNTLNVEMNHFRSSTAIPRSSTLLNWPLNPAKYLRVDCQEAAARMLILDKGKILAVKTQLD